MIYRELAWLHLTQVLKAKIKLFFRYTVTVSYFGQLSDNINMSAKFGMKIENFRCLFMQFQFERNFLVVFHS